MHKRRRVAIFVLRDRNGKIILQHRSKDDPRNPNIWNFFGGGIENNETPEEAVRREAKEELNLEFKELKFFKKYEFENNEELQEKFVYIAPLDMPIDELRKNQNEGQGLGLFDYDDLRNLKLTKNANTILKELFDIKN